MHTILSAEELLAGTNISFEVAIPHNLLFHQEKADQQEPAVKIKPLSLGTFQLIMKGAREDPELIPILMIKEGLVEPKLALSQIKGLPVGLVGFLVEEIRAVSGLSEKKKG